MFNNLHLHEISRHYHAYCLEHRSLLSAPISLFSMPMTWEWDVSYGDGDAKIQTPNIDRLAAGGFIFTDGHSSSGICTPSRFAMLTGQHHWRRFHGIAGAYDGPVFEPDDFTIAKMFKDKGYRTAAFEVAFGLTSRLSANRGGKGGQGQGRVLRLDQAFRAVRSNRDLTATLAMERSIFLRIAG